jgi:hypothetical protein
MFVISKQSEVDEPDATRIQKYLMHLGEANKKRC